MRVLLAMSLTGGLLALPGCTIFGGAEKSTLNALNDAIERLTNQSSDWRQTLIDLQAQLTEDTQATIRGEVQNILDRAVGASGAEFRCNVDFIGTRVKQDLLRIRARLTGGSVDPREPVLCVVSPSSVDMSLPAPSRNQIKVFGYDFDAQPPMTLSLLENNQSIDVAPQLTRQTHYHMTINLGGSGVRFTPLSQKLSIGWNGATIGDIPVIQPLPVPCKTSRDSIESFTRLYVPPHTAGDKEFWGRGPSVGASVTLYNVGSHVDAEIQMSATETGGGDTAASGSERFTIYTAPPATKVQYIIGSAVDQFAGYVDTDWELDTFERGTGGPVKRYEFYGDTSGNDVEEGEFGTSVKVTFNRIDLQLIEIGDCV